MGGLQKAEPEINKQAQMAKSQDVCMSHINLYLQAANRRSVHKYHQKAVRKIMRRSEMLLKESGRSVI